MSAARSPLAELDDVAVVFEALAHSARRQILLVLLARGQSMTSKEVAERFSTTWATVSRHLKTLQAAGLVRIVESEDARERVYQLDTGRLLDVAGSWISHFAPATRSDDQPRSARPEQVAEETAPGGTDAGTPASVAPG